MNAMRASKPPVFSSHHCLGGASSEEADLGSVDAPWSRIVRNQKERTCQFTNVCFDGQRQGWSYFADASEFVGSRKRFSAGLDVWGRGDFGFARAGPPASEDMSFRLHRRPLPARARFLDAPLHVLIAPLAPSNFGHFMGNALYPAFAAAWRLFGASSTRLDYQLIFVGPNQTDLASMRRRCERWGQQAAAAASRRRRLHGGGGGGGGSGRGGGGGGGRVEADGGWRSGAAERRCVRHVGLVSKFVAGLLPGLSSAPPLWSAALGALSRQNGADDAESAAGGGGGALLCVRRLVVGTGELGFSTVHRLANGTRRRVAPILWGDFIEHLLTRLMPGAATGGAHGGGGGGVGGGGGAVALLLLKHGRRAPTADSYATLTRLLTSPNPSPSPNPNPNPNPTPNPNPN